jgi:hypothetical protein
MKKLARAAQFIFGLTIFLAMLGAIYVALKGAYGFLASISTSLSTDTWKAVLLASIPGLVGLFVALYQKYADRKKDIEFKLRDEKVKTYTALLELVFGFFKAAKGKNADAKKSKPSEEAELSHELEMQFMDVSRMLVMWGSDDLIRRYSDWRLLSARTEKPSVADVMGGLGRLILQLRKDMGHKDKNLPYETLLSLFINDIDKLKDGAIQSSQSPVNHLPNQESSETETSARSQRLKSK